MRTVPKLFLFLFIFLLSSIPNLAHGSLYFIIEVENELRGKIIIAENGREIYCGRVLKPAEEYNARPFTASKWGKIDRVVASAVNAIHILRKEGLISILPLKSYSSGARFKSSILTDIPPQYTIFGGGYSPFVGSKVICKPRKGIPEKIEIVVSKERSKIVELIFQNFVGGKIIAVYVSGEKRIIGRVIKPVKGVGRFTGSKFTGIGRVRANHPGVICISTSPMGKIGGFQIIPYKHSLSKEMLKIAWGLTQWMIVDFAPGKYPLFESAILPNWNPRALKSRSWKELLLRRTLVMVKFRDDPYWRFLPPITGRKDHALESLNSVKLFLPIIKRD
ncbi:MAG: hypothetical protein J7M13_02700 [Synergistetes bacterium]|nr:hypothetical protein [Synergistota bacterium]